MLSLHTGYDTAYLTDAVGTGAAATDYYTAAKGEPPGYWQGAGARALGLEGLVDAGRDAAGCTTRTSARTGRCWSGGSGRGTTRRPEGRCTSGSRPRWPRRWPRWAGSRRRRKIRAIRLKERAKFRNRVPFYDYTFSPPKSVTVLWASLLQAAAEADARGERSGGGAARGAGRAGPRSGEAGQ